MKRTVLALCVQLAMVTGFTVEAKEKKEHVVNQMIINDQSLRKQQNALTKQLNTLQSYTESQHKNYDQAIKSLVSQNDQLIQLNQSMVGEVEKLNKQSVFFTEQTTSNKNNIMLLTKATKDKVDELNSSLKNQTTESNKMLEKGQLILLFSILAALTALGMAYYLDRRSNKKIIKLKTEVERVLNQIQVNTDSSMSTWSEQQIDTMKVWRSDFQKEISELLKSEIRLNTENQIDSIKSAAEATIAAETQKNIRLDKEIQLKETAIKQQVRDNTNTVSDKLDLSQLQRDDTKTSPDKNLLDKNSSECEQIENSELNIQETNIDIEDAVSSTGVWDELDSMSMDTTSLDAVSINKELENTDKVIDEDDLSENLFQELDAIVANSSTHTMLDELNSTSTDLLDGKEEIDLTKTTCTLNEVQCIVVENSLEDNTNISASNKIAPTTSELINDVPAGSGTNLNTTATEIFANSDMSSSKSMPDQLPDDFIDTEDFDNDDVTSEMLLPIDDIDTTRKIKAVLATDELDNILLEHATNQSTSDSTTNVDQRVKSESNINKNLVTEQSLDNVTTKETITDKQNAITENEISSQQEHTVNDKVQSTDPLQSIEGTNEVSSGIASDSLLAQENQDNIDDSETTVIEDQLIEEIDPETLFLQAQQYEQSSNLQNALATYEEIINKHEFDNTQENIEFVDKALDKKAKLLLSKNQVKDAINTYDRIISRYDNVRDGDTKLLVSEAILNSTLLELVYTSSINGSKVGTARTVFKNTPENLLAVEMLEVLRLSARKDVSASQDLLLQRFDGVDLISMDWSALDRWAETLNNRSQPRVQDSIDFFRNWNNHEQQPTMYS